MKAEDEALRKGGGEGTDGNSEKSRGRCAATNENLQTGTGRDPFGVQLLHPSFQPKPEPDRRR